MMRFLSAALLVVASAAHAFELKRDSTGETAAWRTPLHFIIDEQLAVRLGAEGSQAAVRAALKTVRVPGGRWGDLDQGSRASASRG